MADESVKETIHCTIHDSCLSIVGTKGAVFGDTHWMCLVALVKNRRALSDYLSAPVLAADLVEIDDKYTAEQKERKKNMKKAAGEQQEDDSEVQPPPEQDAEAPEEQTMPHMMIGEEPTLPLQTDNLKGPQIEKAGCNNLSTKIELKLHTIRPRRWRTSCCRWRNLPNERPLVLLYTKMNQIGSTGFQVATTVKFVVDPGSEDKLADLYMDTWLKDHVDEKHLGLKTWKLVNETLRHVKNNLLKTWHWLTWDYIDKF